MYLSRCSQRICLLTAELFGPGLGTRGEGLGQQRRVRELQQGLDQDATIRPLVFLVLQP